MSLPILIQRYRTTLTLAAAVILGLAGMILLFFVLAGPSFDALTRQYGQGLASLTAKRSAESLLRDDLISLQVILTETAELPRVVSVTAHTIENRLLAQAGDSPGLNPGSAEYWQSFTTPITLQDSVAGYVAVSLDMSELASEHRRWLIKLLVATLALTMMLALLDWWLRKPQQQPEADEPDFDSEEVEHNPAQCRLIICLTNLDRLQQQMSAKSLSELILNFEQQLDSACGLYNGIAHMSQHHQLEVNFNGKDGDECFRALCCAVLLQQLTEQSAALLNIQCIVMTAASDDGDLYHQISTAHKQSKLLQHVLTAERPKVWLAKALLCDSLKKRIQCDTRDNVPETALQVDAIAEPYASLLQKQYQQLQKSDTE